MSSSPSEQDPNRWARVRVLFDAALAQPAAAREAHVRASGESADIVDEVLSLLAHSTGGQSFDPEFMAAPAELPAAPSEAQPGLRLGAWELVELLGVGGMGEVWRARRADGAYEGFAALKLLKRGMDSAAVLQRFAQERQALARLAHPHIARLFDAGLSPQGLPFFVMELVEGQTIDRACAALTLEQRLQLFLQLADAVAHAHRHLLVHRDLKPGNVLVDAEGQVKLLDFGIAKALDPLEDGAGAAEQTLGGQRPFTPHYASPEQIRGEPVSTATDIYSLGVLLYQLLTGQRPYARSAASAAEVAQAVLKETPTRPSSLGPASPDDLTWLATRQRLKGDLDNILLKTLEKSASDRYASVDALAADVHAYLDGRPVSAIPPSAVYLLRKFARRHRLPVALAAAALLALLGGMGATAWQAREARLARDAAQAHLERIQTITREIVLRHGDAITHLPGGLKIKESLLKDLLAHLEKLASEAGTDSSWLTDLAGVYARLAELEGDDTGASLMKSDEAREFARRAIDLAEKVWPAQRGNADFVGWFVQALQVQALGLRAENKPEASVQLMHKALAYLREAEAAVPAQRRRSIQLSRAATLLRMGQFHDTQSRSSLNSPEGALDWFGRSEQLLDEVAAQGPKDLQWQQLRATLHGARALSLARLNGVNEARKDAELAVAARLEAAKLEPANTAVIDGLITEAANLGVILLRLPDADAALDATRLAWSHAEKMARENGPGNKWQTESLPRLALHHGRALVETGHHQEALPVIQRALDGLAARPGAQSNPHVQRLIAWQQVYKARALSGSGQPDQARQLARQSIATLTPLSAEPKARDALLNLGEAQRLMAQLEPAAAPGWRREALKSYQQAHAILALVGDHAKYFQALGGRL
jgi:hypothetical protein